MNNKFAAMAVDDDENVPQVMAKAAPKTAEPKKRIVVKAKGGDMNEGGFEAIGAPKFSGDGERGARRGGRGGRGGRGRGGDGEARGGRGRGGDGEGRGGRGRGDRPPRERREPREGEEGRERKPFIVYTEEEKAAHKAKMAERDAEAIARGEEPRRGRGGRPQGERRTGGARGARTERHGETGERNVTRDNEHEGRDRTDGTGRGRRGGRAFTGKGERRGEEANAEAGEETPAVEGEAAVVEEAVVEQREEVVEEEYEDPEAMPGVTYEEYLKTKSANSKLAAQKKQQVATEKSTAAEK
jgi:hypothetical protein